MKLAVYCVAAIVLGACRTAGGAATANYRIVRASDGRTVDVPTMVRELAEADVVFLGEEHDNDVAHALQLETTRLLLEQRGALALSLEMFESDVQGLLDRYLAGEVTEEQFLQKARPWGNYRQHYRAAVELMREGGWAVLAANVPRPLASKVSRQGVQALRDAPYMPMRVDIERGRYFERFAAVMRGMGGDPSNEGLDLWYQAQCVKDDAMAQSIAHWIGRGGADPPLVVHWCGKFHSDERLGTVERLRWRASDLDLRVVTTISGPDREREPTEAERARADFLWFVPPQPPIVAGPRALEAGR